MSAIIYAGRYGRISPFASPRELRGKVCRVIESQVYLPPGVIAVEIHDIESIWPTTISESDVVPLSETQAELVRKHGTPAEFAAACFNAAPELSAQELHSAIRKYVIEFQDARADDLEQQSAPA